MPEIDSSKYLVNIAWADVPHLSQKAKAEMLRATPPHLRKARSMGIPSLGAGAIYPLDEEEFTVKPFEIPRHWMRGYAMDVGWKRTAVLWGAYDRETDTTWYYDCHYRGQAEPSVHAQAVRSRGSWMHGCMDPAARGRSQIDGQNLWALYTKDVEDGGGGLHLVNADKAVEAGIQTVWDRLSSGRIKVFSSLAPFFAEYRIYRRDENGKIVKENDHLMDDMRYFEMTKERFLKVKPIMDPRAAARARAATRPLDPYIGV